MSTFTDITPTAFDFNHPNSIFDKWQTITISTSLNEWRKRTNDLGKRVLELDQFVVDELRKPITNERLAVRTGPSVIGRASNTTGFVGDISASVDGHVLRRSGTSIGFGQIDTAGIANNAVTTDKIPNNAITTAKIPDNAITTAKIADNAVTSSKIANTAVITAKIQDNAVTTAKIQDNAVTSVKIANNAVTTDKIPNNVITTAKIANNAVTTDKIPNNAIITDKIPDNAITTAKIADNAVTSSKIANTAVTNAKLANDIDASKITTGIFDIVRIPNLDASKITTNTFSTARIPNLDASKITTGVLDKARLPPITPDLIVDEGILSVGRGGTGTNTLTAGHVLIGAGTNAVSSLSRSGIDTRTTFPAASHTHGNITNDGKIGTVANRPLITGSGGTVVTGLFSNTANTFCEGNDVRLSNERVPVNGSVTSVKIANNAVTTDKIPNNAVTTDKIPNNAITTAKIPNNAITTAKIANDAITTAKIANDAITSVKIANNAITSPKIANNAVTTDKIPNNAITTAKIANNAVTNSKLANDIAATKITSGVFNADRIPELPAGRITSGIFDAARIPALDASKITSGAFNADRIPELPAGRITSGVFNIDRIPRLVPTQWYDMSTVSRGSTSTQQNTHATFPTQLLFDWRKSRADFASSWNVEWTYVETTIDIIGLRSEGGANIDAAGIVFFFELPFSTTPLRNLYRNINSPTALVPDNTSIYPNNNGGVGLRDVSTLQTSDPRHALTFAPNRQAWNVKINIRQPSNFIRPSQSVGVQSTNPARNVFFPSYLYNSEISADMSGGFSRFDIGFEVQRPALYSPINIVSGGDFRSRLIYYNQFNERVAEVLRTNPGLSIAGMGIYGGYTDDNIAYFNVRVYHRAWIPQ
jgi:hypothetical protein